MPETHVLLARSYGRSGLLQKRNQKAGRTGVIARRVQCARRECDYERDMRQIRLVGMRATSPIAHRQPVGGATCHFWQACFAVGGPALFRRLRCTVHGARYGARLTVHGPAPLDSSNNGSTPNCGALAASSIPIIYKALAPDLYAPVCAYGPDTSLTRRLPLLPLRLLLDNRWIAKRPRRELSHEDSHFSILPLVLFLSIIPPITRLARH